MTLSSIFLKCSYSASARAFLYSDVSSNSWAPLSCPNFFATFSDTTISTSMSYFCFPWPFLFCEDKKGFLLPRAGFFASDPPPISKTSNLSSCSTVFLFYFKFDSSSITSGIPTSSNLTPPFASTWPSALLAPVEAIFLFLRNSYLAFSRSSFFSAKILSYFAFSYSFSSWTFLRFSARLFSWISCFWIFPSKMSCLFFCNYSICWRLTS